MCPDHYAFSPDELSRSCTAFTNTDPFYQTTCIFIERFHVLRKELASLTIFNCHADSLARECIEVFTHDVIAALKQQLGLPKRSIIGGAADVTSLLSDRDVTLVSGVKLNLDESLPAFADTMAPRVLRTRRRPQRLSESY